ncbi:hypothetical protein GN958_ATG13630 [Phytophthora infestans]|uniref:Uncharacterized protein n=1 Tax=Phytophthora infestans TaxID=4787 RepID=A0A8S9UCE6_PHYIN|nr:hypothetical protein GN958_ATG13630 [Phytophthora infestans]
MGYTRSFTSPTAALDSDCCSCAYGVVVLRRPPISPLSTARAPFRRAVSSAGSASLPLSPRSPDLASTRDTTGFATVAAGHFALASRRALSPPDHFVAFGPAATGTSNLTLRRTSRFFGLLPVTAPSPAPRRSAPGSTSPDCSAPFVATADTRSSPLVLTRAGFTAVSAATFRARPSSFKSARSGFTAVFAATSGARPSSLVLARGGFTAVFAATSCARPSSFKSARGGFTAVFAATSCARPSSLGLARGGFTAVFAATSGARPSSLGLARGGFTAVFAATSCARPSSFKSARGGFTAVFAATSCARPSSLGLARGGFTAVFAATSCARPSSLGLARGGFTAVFAATSCACPSSLLADLPAAADCVASRRLLAARVRGGAVTTAGLVSPRPRTSLSARASPRIGGSQLTVISVAAASAPAR